MTGFLSKYVGVVLVDAETGKIVEGAARPEYWVELRKALTHSDHQRVESVMGEAMNVNANLDGADARMQMKGAALMAQGEETLVRSLVDWNLTDENGESIPLGKPVPEMSEGAREQQFVVTRASLGLLPAPVVTALEKVAVELNQPRGDKEAATFRSEGAAVGPGSEERSGATLDSDLVRV